MKRWLPSMRGWAAIHRWTSLVATLFLLLLCLTGLPLIFHHEIDRAVGMTVEPPDMHEPIRRAGFERVLETAFARHPGYVALFASQEIGDDRVWFVTMAPSPSSAELVQVAVDARDASLLAEPRIGGTGFMAVMTSLHVDLFAGLPGKLLLGAMGVLLLLAIGSGVILYAPFMRRLSFGTVRRDRAKRIEWLDLHNLIGIVTVTWTFVVGATGVVNTWAELLLRHWQDTEVAAMAAGHRPSAGGVSPAPTPTPASAQAALHAAIERRPDMAVAFVAFPGSSFASPRHFGVFLRGSTPLTSRLLTPVMVDIEGPPIADSRTLPWYLTALLISQPLHFGDYGGLPLKILWALLDLATTVVIGSGLYLWVVRIRRRASPRVRATSVVASR